MRHKNTKKSSNITTSFDSKSLSNFSGTIVLNRFMNKLGLRTLFDSIDLELHHNIKFSTSQILCSILLGIFSGLNRVSKIETFSYDPLIQHLLGLKGKIDANTIFNRLKHFRMNENNQIMDIIGQLSGKVHNILGTYSDILDMDSTVRTLFGNQQGAAKGFNPTKKGAKSYHPLLAFLCSTKECLLSWLRPGDAYTSNNSAEFIKHAFGILPEGINKLLVRTDSGFFSDKLMQVIESRPNTDYLIKVKLKNLVSILSEQSWDNIPEMPLWTMTEFMHKASGWKKSRKFVALRKQIRELSEDRLFVVVHYEYFCYVSNIYDSPLEIHRLYGDRGESENWIEAVKRQMFAGCMVTQDFWVNEALWQMSVLAYNLSVWMRKLSDEKSWREEPATFRSWFIQLAGKIVKSGRKTYLKMYEAYLYKDRWLKIEEAVEQLVFE